MTKVFMVLYRVLSDKGGGVNRAVMARSKYLASRGYDVNIVTFNDTNIEETERELRTIGRLDKRAKLLNIYDYYAIKNTKAKMTRKQIRYYKRVVKINEKPYKVYINKKKNTAKYFRNGVYIKYKKWDIDGALDFIDRFSNGRKRISREIFHKQGYVQKKINYDLADKKPMYVQYFTRDGFCYLNMRLEKNKQVKSYYLFERNSNEAVSFSSDSEFYTRWLNELCLEQEEKPYVICDKHSMYSTVMNMKKNISYTIYFIHSNHLKAPYILGSSIRSIHSGILNNLHKLDRVVVLTEKQKQDIIKQVGNKNNISVIPHAADVASKQNVEKDNKAISMIARLTPTKQIDEAIDAFQYVVSQVPDATLKIYGSGDLDKELKEQIKYLNLEQNVFLKGFSTNTDLIYKQSLATLLTSKSEGFAMVLIESMANGTPAISYDVNYGPSDIITNREDGYLIKPDKKVLANKIIELLNNPLKANKMGEKGRRNVHEKFNEKRITDQWVYLLEQLKE